MKAVYFAAAACFGTVYAIYPSVFGAVLMLLLIGWTCLRKQVTAALLLFSGFLIFFCWAHFYEENNKTKLTQGEIQFRGVLKDEPAVDGDAVKVRVIHSSGEILAMIYKAENQADRDRWKTLYGGTGCTFKGTLQMPKHAVNPNGFDYSQYLSRYRIHWVFKAAEAADCSEKKGLLSILHHLRMLGSSRVQELFPDSSSGLVQALLFGERTQMDEDLLESYQSLGTIHLLAISGMQVGLLAAFLWTVFLRLGLTHEKARLFLLIILPSYGVLTGESESVMRAVYMAELLLLFKIFRIPAHPMHILIGTLLFMLFTNPLQLFQPGFQLTFLVTAALILSAPVLQQLSMMKKAFLISIISQASSLPVIYYSFYGLSLGSFAVNLIYVPLFSFVIFPLSMTAFLLSFLQWGLADFTAAFLSRIIQSLDKMTLYLASRDPFMLVLGKPGALLEAMTAGCVIFLLASFEMPLKGMKKLLPYVLLGSLLILKLCVPYLSPSGKITFIDIGQGDSILIELPWRKGVFLIDTGGRAVFGKKEQWRERKNTFSLAKDVTMPLLRSKGITKLNGLFLTHGDMDHTGEAEALMENMSIEKVYIPKGFIKDESDRDIIQKAEEMKMEIIALQDGDKLNLGEQPIYVLSPAEKAETKNDGSLVLYTVLGGKSWLFTGDLEKLGEQKLLQHYPELHADYLKAGHHGSKGSSSEEFLDRLRPEAAIISAGENNRYHHPHTETLKRLEKRSIKVYRTDKMGAIQYQFTGKDGTFAVHPPYDEVSSKDSTKAD